MRCERGQAAVGLVLGAAILVAATALLAGALLSAGPSAWQAAADERARARERVLGTDLEMQPEWRRVWGRDAR